MYTNMADAEPEPKSAVEYLEDTIDFDTPGIVTGNCIDKAVTEHAVNEGGVPDNMISFNDLVVLIVLYHGRIEENIESRLLLHPVIQSSDFPHITNLANITLAPTGMVNMGLQTELNSKAEQINASLQASIIRGFQSQIDDIQDRANKVITPSTNLRSSRYYKLCDYCIDFTYRAYDGIPKFVSGLVGYTFKGVLRFCRSKLFPMIGGTKRPRAVLNTPSTPSAPPAATLDFKMSPDLCVVIFDNVRRSIKEVDDTEFPTLCRSISAPSESCKSAIRNASSRCRILNVIKGFDAETLLPFVNKYLAYNSTADVPLDMGVVKLTFSIDRTGNVTIKKEKYNPLHLMDKIKYSIVDTRNEVTGQNEQVYWSTMKNCIDTCTRYNSDDLTKEVVHDNQTVLVYDLTCSSMPRTLDVPVFLNNLVNPRRAAVPGGGGIIKKNKYSRKRIRTRKIKNRSTNVKYLRNRRNIKNLKRKTKKVRRTHRK